MDTKICSLGAPEGLVEEPPEGRFWAGRSHSETSPPTGQGQTQMCWESGEEEQGQEDLAGVC